MSNPELDVNERRYMNTKNAMAFCPDPVIEHLGSLEPLAEVHPSVTREHQQDIQTAAACMCCCIPFAILCCLPCRAAYPTKGMMATYDQYAKGRSLILTEKALIYRLEKGAFTDATAVMPLPKEKVEHQVEIYIPLDEDFGLDVDPAPSFFYGETDALRISWKGMLIATMDVMDAQTTKEFVTAVEEQKAKLQGLKLNKYVRAAHVVRNEVYIMAVDKRYSPEDVNAKIKESWRLAKVASTLKSEDDEPDPDLIKPSGEQKKKKGGFLASLAKNVVKESIKALIPLPIDSLLEVGPPEMDPETKEPKKT